MERDFENRQRHMHSRLIINDYPSSHLPPPQRPKFWGEQFTPPTTDRLPQRALVYVDRPCISRDGAASDKPKQHGLSSTSELSQSHPYGGDGSRCRLESSGSGLSPAHCSSCYVSSAVGGGYKAGSRGAAPSPDTSAEVLQLSALVKSELEKAAASGCGSLTPSSTTATKPEGERRASSKAMGSGRGSHSVADASRELKRYQRRLPQPSLQFVPSPGPAQQQQQQQPQQASATTSTAPGFKPVPFEAWTDVDYTRGSHDYDRRKSDDERHSRSSRTWKHADDYVEPVECELARSGRRYAVEDQYDRPWCRSAGGRYDHDGAVSDLGDVGVDWSWTEDTSSSAVIEEQQQRLSSVDYEEQLRRHGWRMEVPGDPLNLKRPCMPARPAFSQNIQPSASPGPTAGIPVPRRDATMFHNVQPWPPPLEYVIHPELRTEHICPSSSASLLSLPARQCDISAAVIQRDSHRRYIRNSFVY